MSPQPPIPSADNGRLANGQFGRGNKFARGRPARPSVFRIAQERAEQDGTDLEGEVWAVVCKLIEQAKAGCTKSAALVLDALCERAPDKLEVTQGERNLVNMSEDERAARISYYVRLAERRAKEAEAKAAAAGENGETDVAH